MLALVLTMTGGPKGTDVGNGESQYQAGPYAAGHMDSGQPKQVLGCAQFASLCLDNPIDSVDSVWLMLGACCTR